MYAVLSFIVGGAVDLFYRRVAIGSERVPAGGPVLLIANHPNGLVDPVVVSNTAGRQIRMLAKAPLFDMPGISLLVKGAGALPVYRAKDGADTAQNAKTFQAVAEALVVDKSAVLIFPEGISHDEPQLQKLKTGGARMALQACDAGATDLVVIPVGLVYRDKERFRSEVATQVGAAIAVAPYLERGRHDDPEVVKALTNDMAAALRGVTINLEQWEDLPLLEAVDAIWRIDDPSRTARIKQLADGVQLLRNHAPERLDVVRAMIVEWTKRLDSLGVAPRDLSPEHSAARANPTKAAWFAVRNLAVALVGLPVALFGALFWAAPFWLIHALYSIIRPDRDVAATGKILASIVFFPLWYALATWLAWHYVGPGTTGLIATTAPVAGMTTRWFFRSRKRALRDATAFLSLLVRRDLKRQLEAERDLLLKEIDALGKLAEELREAQSAESPSGQAQSATGEQGSHATAGPGSAPPART